MANFFIFLAVARSFLQLQFCSDSDEDSYKLAKKVKKLKAKNKKLQKKVKSLKKKLKEKKTSEKDDKQKTYGNINF